MADDDKPVKYPWEDEANKAADALRPGAGSPLAKGGPQSGYDWALDKLAESASAGMAAKLKADQEKAMGETVRQTLERVDRESMAGSTPPPPPPPPSDPPRSEPEPPPSPKAGDHEHHPTTKTLDYLALGIILAPAPEVIAMYLRHEDIDWQRVVISFVVSIIIGSAILWFAHGWHKTAGGLATFKGRINRADDYFVVRAAIIAFFMIVPVLIAPLVSGVPVQLSPAQTGFTQQQVDEKISNAVANLNSQLTEANRQKEAERREADAFRQQIQNAPPRPPTPEEQVPINWQPDFQLNWYGDQKIAWIRFIGVSTALARIKDAYVISTLTGHKEQLDVANATNFNERWKIDRVEPIPKGAQVFLVYEPKPSPPLPDFMSQWGAFEFHVVYDNKEYVKIYSQDYINSKMTREMPGVFGPRVTPRNDK
jgi:hypothetical protein